MPKTDPVKKVVNGEIADADDINQIAENIGSEGGTIPYSDTDQNRSTDGSESIGATAYPWGNINLNRDADFNEIDSVSHTIASSVTISQLRKFISQKDTPASYVGQAAKAVVVKDDETGLQFDPAPGAVEVLTTGGTWTAPAGVNYIAISMCGGGGGGAGADTSSNAAGGGGAGAESIERHIMKVTPGNTYSITIGAAGATGAHTAAGGNGGDTIFVGDTDGSNYTLTASGGLGAPSQTGAAATTGNIVLTGGDGDTSSNPGAGVLRSIAGGAGGSGVGTNASAAAGGGGGGSAFGKGGESVAATAGVDGGIGAGGSGGGTNGNNSGGTGGVGIMILEYNANGTPV